MEHTRTIRQKIWNGFCKVLQVGPGVLKHYLWCGHDSGLRRGLGGSLSALGLAAALTLVRAVCGIGFVMIWGAGMSALARKA